ncbi:unnamed protein product [Rotaria sp. Silwood2]|nr:unnamed protein product [Rotaria sp. Silwood2]CAF3436691.1 unnamed protein product [Rotaria sp. Silwood2]CAF4468402.1 unnamed protein product [Rotaria sp. Silwood2]CAF4571646.1 unnamed protein product [Rotaria sp. Silwood2]
MVMWLFWITVCLAIGQLTHSSPVGNKPSSLDSVIGTAVTADDISSSNVHQTRSVRSNEKGDDDDDDLNSLHNVKLRSISDDYRRKVFDLTNQARQQGRYCGQTWYPATTQLSWNDRLSAAAQKHAASMLYYNYFSHTGIDGSSFVDRIAAEGYSRSCAGGENIAGNQTPEATVTAWLRSSGHCANIMNRNFKAIGVGYAQGGRYGDQYGQVIETYSPLKLDQLEIVTKIRVSRQAFRIQALLQLSNGTRIQRNEK